MTTGELAGRVLDILGDAAEAASEHLHNNDRSCAMAALAAGVSDATAALAPYAGPMPTPPHMLIVLSNGSTLRTTQNTPGDLAGLINAGEAKIYQVADLDGVTHHLVVSAILDFYAVA